MFGAIDNFSGKMLNAFGTSKNKMVDFVSFSFKLFKVMYVRLDNTGEHEALKEQCRKHGTNHSIRNIAIEWQNREEISSSME